MALHNVREHMTPPRIAALLARQDGLVTRTQALACGMTTDGISTVRGLRVTGLPLTVVEAAVELDDGSVFLDRALQVIRQIRRALSR